MNDIQRTQLVDRLGYWRDNVLDPKQIIAQRQIYIIRHNMHDSGGGYFMQMSYNGEYWNYSWYGYGRPEPEWHPLYEHTRLNHAELMQLLRHRNFHVVRPFSIWCMMTHDFGQVPDNSWIIPGKYRPIYFLSPCGILRGLAPTPCGGWQLRTMTVRHVERVPMAPDSVIMRADGIREMVRNNRWLTILSGDRAPMPGETARSFALSR